MTGSSGPKADPLAPIELVVTALSALVVALFVVSVPFAILGNTTFLGVGDKQACATVDTGTIAYFTADGVRPSEGVMGLRSDASSWPERLQICDRSPKFGAKAASIVGMSTDLALVLGFLVVTRRLIRASRRHGLFAPVVADRTRALGLYLLFGGLAASLLKAVAGGIVISNAVDGTSWANGLRHFDLSWTLVITGLGVVTFARVLRQAVELQDEVDATI